MNATQIADRHALAANFIRHHSSFLDQWDYVAKKLPDQTWDDVTHLDISVTPYGLAGVTISCHGPNARMLMRQVCKRIGGKWDKHTTSYDFELSRSVQCGTESVDVTVVTSREAVCTPRVVGQTQRIVPAQEERVVTEDIVEWDCPPSLLELTND